MVISDFGGFRQLIGASSNCFYSVDAKQVNLSENSILKISLALIVQMQLFTMNMYLLPPKLKEALFYK
jgi:hypothetical protein